MITGGILVTEEGPLEADLAVAHGKISAIGKQTPVPGAQTIDARNKLVFPGVIDAHTHYGLVTRGAVTADGWSEGTRSAAAGGVTTCIDYADPLPGRPLADGLKRRQSEADNRAYIDYSLHMVVHNWAGRPAEELRRLRATGVASLKVFTTYEQKLPQAQLAELLIDAAAAGMLVTVHAEDEDLVQKFRHDLEQREASAPQNHGASRPPVAEAEAIRKVLAAAEKDNLPVYFVHVSTGEGAGFIAAARAKGQPVFGETCPHYLLLDDRLYAGPDPRPAIMTPPLRPPGNQQELWQALGRGTLDLVATDHCAYTLEQKRAGDTCFTTLPGIPGSETLLPLMYTYGVRGGRFDLTGLSRLLAAEPARIFGLYPRKGRIGVGSDADLVIFDPELEVTLRGRDLHSAAGYTPFEGFEVKGYPQTTILRGEVIYDRGRFLAPTPLGQFIPAKTSSIFAYPGNKRRFWHED